MTPPSVFLQSDENVFYDALTPSEAAQWTARRTVPPPLIRALNAADGFATQSEDPVRALLLVGGPHGWQARATQSGAGVPLGSWIALLSYAPELQGYTDLLLREVAPEARRTWRLLPRARTERLRQTLHQVLSQVEDAGVVPDTQPFDRVRGVALDCPEFLGDSPRTGDVQRCFLLLQPPAGPVQVLDSPLAPDAARHYARLGWAVSRATVNRDWCGIWTLAGWTGFGQAPSPRRLPAVLDGLSLYLAAHPWASGPAPFCP